MPSYFDALTPSWATANGPPRTAHLVVVNPGGGLSTAPDPN
jgi:hypothetical protein